MPTFVCVEISILLAYRVYIFTGIDKGASCKTLSTPCRSPSLFFYFFFLATEALGMYKNLKVNV